jgi:hypothetical protein
LANLIVALACEWPFLWLVYGFLEPNAFAPSWMMAFAAISWSLPALLFAVLTAPIFKLKLPAFRRLHWIGLHVAVGLVLKMIIQSRSSFFIFSSGLDRHCGRRKLPRAPGIEQQSKAIAQFTAKQ